VAFLDEQCPEGSVEQLGDISRSLASREGHPCGPSLALSGLYSLRLGYLSQYVAQ
jgi:hypothetical protein